MKQIQLSAIPADVTLNGALPRGIRVGANTDMVDPSARALERRDS
jgi:hypothetical protein